jgi:hypothetical protein
LKKNPLIFDFGGHAGGQDVEVIDFMYIHCSEEMLNLRIFD